ncbi:MAG TPA: hypothetical protein VKD68_01955 [Methyloceanibacter sp.]|nr:hypothetical protein [Methyloceanibacter sp.]
MAGLAFAHEIARGWGLLLRSLRLCGLLLLAGCGFSHHGPGHAPEDGAVESHEPAFVKQNNDAIDQCEKLHPNSDQKPASPRVKCFNDATIAYYSALIDRRDSNEVRSFTEKMASTAKRYDAGQISSAEFNSEKEEAIVDFTSAIMQRPDSDAKVDAGRMQHKRASNEPTATLLPKQMTCVPVATGVNCY